MVRSPTRSRGDGDGDGDEDCDDDDDDDDDDEPSLGVTSCSVALRRLKTVFYQPARAVSHRHASHQ